MVGSRMGKLEKREERKGGFVIFVREVKRMQAERSEKTRHRKRKGKSMRQP